MALIKVTLPLCDICGEPWLPDKRLPDGSKNPAYEFPELSKRCGKCKSMRWNWKMKEALLKAEKAGKMTSFPSPVKGKPPSVSRVKTCRHGLVRCPTCHPPKP